MFVRTLIRKTSPISRKAVQCLLSQNALLCRRDFNVYTKDKEQYKMFPKIYLSQRFYSEQPSLENVVVNYNYVRQATDNKNILIVDVREPEEIKEHGKIPNSINIPLGDVSAVLSTMPSKQFENVFNRPKPEDDTEIIFYCMIGKRSGMAQQNALNLGYKNAKNYLGSWNEWAGKKL